MSEKNHTTSPQQKKIMQHINKMQLLNTKIKQPLHKKKLRDLQKNHTTSPPQNHAIAKKSRNLSTKNLRNFSSQKLMQPLHTNKSFNLTVLSQFEFLSFVIIRVFEFFQN